MQWLGLSSYYCVYSCNLNFLLFIFYLALMCYIMVFGLPTVFVSNIRSSFLLCSTYRFLPGMIQKEVLRKLLRGMCISSSICSYISQAERMEIMLFSYKVCLLCNYLFKNRILSRSQELKVGKYDKLSDVLEQHL